MFPADVAKGAAANRNQTSYGCLRARPRRRLGEWERPRARVNQVMGARILRLMRDEMRGCGGDAGYRGREKRLVWGLRPRRGYWCL